MRSNKSVGTLCMIAAIFVACSRVSWGGELNIVSPSEAEFVEGDGSGHWGSPAPVRLQMLFPADDFMSLPESHRTITGFAFRQDESTSITEPIMGTGTVILSTTTADELVPTYEDNHREDRTVVFDGELIWQAVDTGLGPRDFEFVFPFDTRFTYDPSLGRNLLVDFSSLEIWSNVNAHIDRQSTDAITWQAGHNLTVSNFARRFVIVTQFTFIPEPSTIVSAALGLVGLLTWRRRKDGHSPV